MQIFTNISGSDISLLRFIYHNRMVSLDNFMYYVSYFSTYINIAILLSILAVSLIRKSKPLRLIFYKMVAVMIVAALMSTLLKSVIQRERPFVTYPDIVKLSEGGSSSFPSGHTLECFAVAVAFSLLIRKKKLCIPVFIWASLVAYSRMALGVHYPSDVLSGMMIGAFIGWIVPWVTNRFFVTH